MSYAVGYGPAVWSAGGYYFWIPMVAPFCGCMFGGLLYDLFIYSGPESPVNSPRFGLDRYMKRKESMGRQEKEDLRWKKEHV